MIIINEEKCNGCGLCKKDCVSQVIELKENKAFCTKKNCLRCYHCIAICPKNAIITTSADMNEVTEYNLKSFNIDPEVFLNSIKFRRSVRYYTEEKVERKKIQMLIEAGRFTPTGGNRENVSYIIVEDGVKKLTELSLKSLYSKSKTLLENSENISDSMRRYTERWEKMYHNYIKNQNTRENLFFNTKTVVLILSDNIANGNLAACNMEMMAHILGLGACHIGFFLYAYDGNAEIKEFLGLKKEQKIAACLTIGYPSIEYKRTVPRKKSVVEWR